MPPTDAFAGCLEKHTDYVKPMSSQTLGALECRSYVYVLECKSCDETEHDYWYVGISSPGHLSTRIDQHWSCRAARWTRTHKPVRVAAVHRCESEGDRAVALEREITLEVMRQCCERHGEHGWMRVRGGPWCSEKMTLPPPGLNARAPDEPGARPGNEQQ